MADTDLIERVNVIAGLLVLSPEQSEALMDAATALAEKDARIAEVKSEAIAATTRYQDAENDVHNLRAQLTASRAECEGLRAAVSLAKKDILEWISSFPNADHAGSLNALSEIDAALSLKETDA